MGALISHTETAVISVGAGFPWMGLRNKKGNDGGAQKQVVEDNLNLISVNLLDVFFLFFYNLQPFVDVLLTVRTISSYNKSNTKQQESEYSP